MWDYCQLPLTSSQGVLRGLTNEEGYIRGSLFKISHSSDDKNIPLCIYWCLKVSKHHNKLNQFQYKLEGIYIWGLYSDVSFLFPGKWA